MKMEARIRFVYSGPNRRSDWPVAEFEVEFDPESLAKIARVDAGDILARMNQLPGNSTEDSSRLALRAVDDPADRCGWLLAILLLRLQRAAGQQVEALGLVATDDCAVGRAFVAYDYPDCFQELFPLASQLLIEWLDPDSGNGQDKLTDKGPDDSIRAVIERFRDTGTPADSWALARAAADRGIPIMRVDRPPYDPIEGPFRIRPHSLMRFGHGYRQITMDGTFCVTRSQHLHPLVFDRASLFDKLAQLGWSMPETIRCTSMQRVKRSLRRIDFPMAVRSARRGAHPAAPAPLAESAAVEAMAEGILGGSVDVLLQSWVFGTVFKVVVVGRHCLFVLKQVDNQMHRVPIGDCPSSLQDRLVKLAESLDVGLLVATVVIGDKNRDRIELLDLELAPRLDELLSGRDDALETSAGHFMEWLFPDPAVARIPIAAITGTNGKTTTCHMTRAILSATGVGVGMTCSDGCMVRDEWISDLEEGHFVGHTIVLDNPGTEVAVLESTRGGAGSIGMGFNRCSVAACLNITEDHLEDRIGLHTLDEVAALKRTILDRSDDAIVLNADDPRCLAMRDDLPGRRVGLVSVNRRIAELADELGRGDLIATLETIDGQPWLVLHQGEHRWPIIAGSDIPLSFDNGARYNLSNALHAAAISFLMGASNEHIAEGLAGLEPDFETFYGRLNYYRELPFDVIMDYAHNPDGLEKLCEFVDRQTIAGRKLINLSVGAQNPDDFIRRSAVVTAGHFDHYVCKNFGLLMGREPEERPRLLQEGLLQAGVPGSAITCVEEEFESIDETFRLAQRGDLVVIIGGKRKRLIWDWIRSFPERCQ